MRASALQRRLHDGQSLRAGQCSLSPCRCRKVCSACAFCGIVAWPSSCALTPGLQSSPMCPARHHKDIIARRTSFSAPCMSYLRSSLCVIVTT